MILSDRTIEILNSFSAINPSMVLDWDGSIAVVSQQGNVFAVAKVPEKYPHKWSIYDVPQFMGIIRLMDQNATADTKVDHVILKQPNSEVKYRFAEPMLIKHTDQKDGKLSGIGFTAQITTKEMQQLVKSALLLRNTHVRIQLDPVVPNQCLLESFNLGNGSASNYKLRVPAEILEESDTSGVFKIEFFNTIKNDYVISMAKKCVQLESVDGDVKYWIGKEKE